MNAAPRAERARIPAEYGVSKAKAFVDWQYVADRFTQERVYWLAVTDERGRPHVRPVDGLHVDGVLYVGGSPKARWVGLVGTQPTVTVHLAGDDVLIWEGEAEVLRDISDELAARLAAASNAKFPEYAMTPDAYRSGVIAIRPRKVICWTEFTKDPTRFRFSEGGLTAWPRPPS